MRSAGFTLIELLVVISIISILSVVGFVNFKGFSEDQATDKAVGQIQTLLRLAQSNATSGILCGTSGGVPWSLILNSTSIDLACGSTNIVQKTYTLDSSAEIDTIIGSGCTGSIMPVYLTYSPGVGALTFYAPGASNTCNASVSWTFTIKNTRNNTTKSFIQSKGGAIQ